MLAIIHSTELNNIRVFWPRMRKEDKHCLGRGICDSRVSGKTEIGVKNVKILLFTVRKVCFHIVCPYFRLIEWCRFYAHIWILNEG